MATTYTTGHHLDSGKIHILRNDQHVATYDPVAETTELVEEDFQKYSNHIGRVVRDIVEGSNPPPTEEPAEEPAEEPVNTTEVKYQSDMQDATEGERKLRRTITELQIENLRLRDELTKQGGSDHMPRLPERFADEVDLTGAPPRDPTLGDLTPMFIAWARENMDPAIFAKRYHNRLPKE